uniref:Uncharacterized protein n=1 Tax=Setaria viridis TaxID=4556 RepID=A0A4U6VRK9_SETVI|nr:hypothetical protein SEVIR_2G107650v2 [Setaria viridis]
MIITSDCHTHCGPPQCLADAVIPSSSATRSSAAGSAERTPAVSHFTPVPSPGTPAPPISSPLAAASSPAAGSWPRPSFPLV